VQQTIPQSKPPGPSLRLSLVLVVIGTLLAVPSFVIGIAPIVRLQNSGTFTAPGTDSRHLGAGQYFLYEDVGNAGLGFSTSGDDRVTIAPSDVSVTSADHVPLTISEPTTIESMPFGGRRFRTAVAFTTPAAGEYLISVRTRDGRTHKLLVARSFSHIIRSVLVWFAIAGIGGIIFLVGIVLLIVGAVRRGRVQRAAVYAPAAYPAGWYPDPDPQGAGRWRYWDGTRWTEHVR